MRIFTSNTLKVIAILTMIIDHFGYYFYNLIPQDIYIVCRIIGRISMPIFVFLLVEGYFHTKDVKKYISRLLVLAVATQIIITVIAKVNTTIVPAYVNMVSLQLNIVFNLVLSLVVITLISKKDLFEFSENIDIKVKKVISIILRVVLVLIILVLVTYLPIDYEFEIILMATSLYIIKVIENNKNKDYKIIFTILKCLIIFISCLFQGYFGLFSILAFPFIILYNGKLGKKSNIIRNAFYISFPLNHAIFYLVSLLYFYYSKT